MTPERLEKANRLQLRIKDLEDKLQGLETYTGVQALLEDRYLTMDDLEEVIARAKSKARVDLTQLKQQFEEL